jgi:hypothetical protein
VISQTISRIKLFLVCIFFSGKFYTGVLRKLYGRITMIDTDVIPTNNNKQITINNIRKALVRIRSNLILVSFRALLNT